MTGGVALAHWTLSGRGPSRELACQCEPLCRHITVESRRCGSLRVCPGAPPCKAVALRGKSAEFEPSDGSPRQGALQHLAA
jgi:hypothetical protein